MVMEEITVDRAKQIANKKGLKPGRVKGTTGVQFTKGKNNRLDVIDWDEFEKTLHTRRLSVYESGGWMKIMKRNRYQVSIVYSFFVILVDTVSLLIY